MIQPDFARLTDQAESVVRKLGVPACPDALMSISRELRRDMPDTQKVAGMVARDVAASAMLLKTVLGVLRARNQGSLGSASHGLYGTRPHGAAIGGVAAAKRLPESQCCCDVPILGNIHAKRAEYGVHGARQWCSRSRRGSHLWVVSRCRYGGVDRQIRELCSDRRTHGRRRAFKPHRNRERALQRRSRRRGGP